MMSDESPTTEELARRAGEAKFVSLVTYKRDGSAVGAPDSAYGQVCDSTLWPSFHCSTGERHQDLVAG